MKVKELIKMLEVYEPDEELCVLYWDKNNFEYQEDDILFLSDEAWLKVCKEFDQWGGAGQEVGEWIADAVTEHAEITS